MTRPGAAAPRIIPDSQGYLYLSASVSAVYPRPVSKDTGACGQQRQLLDPLSARKPLIRLVCPRVSANANASIWLAVINLLKGTSARVVVRGQNDEKRIDRGQTNRIKDLRADVYICPVVKLLIRLTSRLNGQ